MKICYMTTDILLRDDDNSIISGHTVLVDVKGMSLGHIAQCPPTFMK